MEPFVSAEWLSDHRDAVKLVDIRFKLDGSSGRTAYEAGHIPGAVYVELADVLAEPEGDSSLGRHPLPRPERFAGGLSLVGIGDGDTVIAYDDAGGVMAARLVWLLRIIGHPAALLDGGPLAAVAGTLETGPGSTPPPARFAPVPWPAERFADIDETGAAAADGVAADGSRTVVIDARDRARFAGGPDPVDPRSGHIPGARNVPVAEHLDADHRMASPEQLRETFAAVGIEPGTAVISYCGSGVTACHNLLALERAGLGPARLFPGSWSRWSRDPSRPVAVGAR
jgi:thiosulfate/3-mercaptopyruvate sulfurtransferase